MRSERSLSDQHRDTSGTLSNKASSEVRLALTWGEPSRLAYGARNQVVYILAIPRLHTTCHLCLGCLGEATDNKLKLFMTYCIGQVEEWRPNRPASGPKGGMKD